MKKFVNLGAPDQTAVAKATEGFNKEAKMLDAHLAKQKYLVGDALTIADFTVAAPLFHAQGAGMPVAPYANVRRLVRARVGAAVLERNRAANGRGGVIAGQMTEDGNRMLRPSDC